MGRMIPCAALALALISACGDDGGPTGPQPLQADPAVVTGCSKEPPAQGSSRAKWIDCPEELPSGLLVSGRVGDVLLENDRVKVVIRGFGEGYYMMGTKPGGIVDAARRGADDQIKEILGVFGLQSGGADEVVITEAGDDGPATLVVRGPATPVPFIQAAIDNPPVAVIVEQRYILEPDSDALKIETVLYADGEDANVEVGDALFFGGAINSWAPGRGPIAGSGSVEFVASTGGRGTSYGLVYPPEALAAIRWADIANVKLGFGPTRTLGNPAPIDRWLVIGDGSAASVTERAWTLRGVATGTIQGTTAPDVNVMVTDASDAPITMARSDENGAYRVVLPVGSYQLQAQSPGRAPGATQAASVTAGGDASLDLPAGGSGTLSVTVRDGDGNTIPARVTIHQNGDRRIEYAGADGTLVLPLPPGGDLVLDVSRGMEYDAYTVDPLVITDGQTTTVNATLDRVVDTDGWIAVDTHIHSEMLTDSQIDLRSRLRAIAAEGIEVPISTDHDFVTDYTPVVQELGLGEFLKPQVGVETSSLTWGHVNTWPLIPDYDHAAGNAVPWYGQSPGQVYALMRQRGDNVIQLNHPRSGMNGNFDAINFDADTAMAGAQPSDLGLPDSTNLSDFDFDALEVANALDKDQFDKALRDYLGLVATGHPAAATGSSDSHGRSAFVGESRTYVWVGAGNDDPRTVDLDAVNRAIEARKVVVGQGAFVTAALVDPATGQPVAPGELVNLEGKSEATLHIRLQAPPWMPLDHITVYGGRQVATTLPLDSSDTAVVRFDGDVTLPLTDGDGFFLVLVQAAGPGTPVLGDTAGSLTNPLLYDHDGDGAWMP